MKNIITFLTIGIILLFSSTLFAQERFYNDITGASVQSNATFIVEDDKFADSDLSNDNIESTQLVRNLLLFEVDHSDTTVYSFPDSVVLDLQITLAKDNQPNTVINQSLSLCYDTTATVVTQNKAFAFFEGGHRMTVEILAKKYFNKDGSIALGSANLPIRLAGEIYIQRLYNFNQEQAPSFSSVQHQAGNLVINWQDALGAQEYDLEWTFYDSLSLVGQEILNNASDTYPDFDFLFRCNATRITTDQNTFEIPLLYPNGFIFYRIRAARFDTTGLRNTSRWSSNLRSGTLANYTDQYEVPWHQFNLNWQAQTSFAEDGKNVPSVRYFDGSLRERQAVTFSNAIGMSIAEQTIYDHQGRPAVSVMAAPTFVDSIAYDAYFATNDTGNPYSKSDFDTGDCTVFPDSMSSNTGAARYYSSNNPRGTERFNKYIPKAEGYPFAVTEYMPDLTGRIKKQSGVGKTFRMGGGHETQYFYGKPSQEELDRLFGNDVGDAAHYFKNMVIDANGQASVSYVDAHGRTIATALAGAPASNVDSLVEVKANFQEESTVSKGFVENFKRDLLENVESNFDLTSTYSLLVAVESDYAFRYSSDSVIYKQDCLPANICYDCAYDLNIKITDNCGNLFNGGQPFDTTLANITVFDTTANSTGFDFEYTFQNLPIGEYQITKSLTISQQALDTYLADFLNRESCLPSLDDLVQEFIDSTDFSGCNIDYADCLAQVGSLTDLIQEFKVDIIAAGENFEVADSLELVALHESLLAECENLNPAYSECANLTQNLKIDISPSGQYATFQVDANGAFSVSDPNSIFATTSNPSYTYRFQECFNEALNQGIIPQIDTLFLAGQFKRLDQLTPLELIENWRSEWADALVVCHPEYACLDGWCNDPINYAFDEQLYNLETYQDALIQFPELDKDVDAVLSSDPFFTVGTADYDTMLLRLSNLSPNESCFQVSIFEVIASAAYCGGNFNCQTLFGQGCDRDNDLAWALYRQYYLGLKETYKDYGVRQEGGIGDPTNLNILERAPNTSELATLQNAFPPATYLDPYQASFNPSSNIFSTISNPSTDTTVVRSFDLSSSILDDCTDSVQVCLDWDFLFSTDVIIFRETELVPQTTTSVYLTIGNNVTIPFSLTHSYDGTFNISGCINLAKSEVEMASFHLALPRTNSQSIPDYLVQSLGVAFTATIVSTINGCQTDCIVPLSKTPRLVPAITENIPATVAAFENKRDSLSMELVGQCDTFCINNAEAWLAILESGCTDLSNPTIYNNVRDRLIAVCQSGCDADHPFGASTTPMGVTTSFGDVSFTQIIEDVLSGGVCDSLCNSNQITFPAPYNTPFYHGALEQTAIAYNDDCLCENLTDLQTDYQNDNEGFTTFTDYINQFAEEQLFQSEVDSLLAYCDGSSGCSTLANSIIIPPYLECNVCKTCSEINTALTGFSCPSGDTLQLQANYLNQALGWDLLPQEYQAFLDSCALSSVGLLCPASPFGAARADTTCYATLIYQAQLNAAAAYDALLDSLEQTFIDKYLATCLDNLNEALDATGDLLEYHYTLYYYDQANNLIQTVPPNGVEPLAVVQLEAVDLFRDSNIGSAIYPNHTFLTNYKYNTLNQVVFQDSPDTDSMLFWYDEVGRLVASQDGRQRPSNFYSYTLRDNLGRTIEVGEITQTTAMTDSIARFENRFETWIAAGSKKQVTNTYYDEASFDIVIDGDTLQQENLRPRIASITLNENGQGGYDFATHYSYDIMGNISTIVQEIAQLDQFGQRFKRIDYEYDYISENINRVYYQKDRRDQFTYKYEYDENNRPIACFTSLIETVIDDSPLWENEATYEYYLHGSKARTEIGQRRVQGIDCAFTLQGWKKGMNSSILDVSRDIGRDGILATDAARDALAYTIGFYDDDYVQIKGNSFELNYSNTSFGNSNPSLFNGNIRHVSSEIVGLNPIGYSYTYDQLQRLKSMKPYTQIDKENFTWQSFSNPQLDYQVSLKYDSNGNIKRLTRRGNNFKVMDNLFYNYNAGTNQLQFVDDFVTVGDFNNDIDDQLINNYRYDGSGNLIEDNAERIQLTWSVYGKIKQISGTGGNDDNVIFGYDATQNRVIKEFEEDEGITTTYYIRDLLGNAIAIYQQDENNNLKWTEQYLYSDSRFGVFQANITMESDTTEPFFSTLKTLHEGNRLYELDNHLGNILVTINDRKRGKDSNADNLIDYYDAVVINAQDYYPFGMLMPGRSYSNSNGYRFGFNGMESNNEISGINNSYTTYFRQYDPRLGRWFSIDPKQSKFADHSSYSFNKNSVITHIDDNGASPISALAKLALKHGAKSALKKYAKKYIEKRIKSYTKGNLKHLAKDLAEDLNEVYSTLDQSWWEMAIELVPVAGDAYGATKFGIRVSAAWKKLQDVENKYNKILSESLTGKALEKFKKRQRKAGVRSARVDQKNGISNGDKYVGDGNVHGHHVDPVKDNPARMSDPSNIEMMDKEAHKKLHKGELELIPYRNQNVLEEVTVATERYKISYDKPKVKQKIKK